MLRPSLLSIVCGLLAFLLSAAFINHGLVDSNLPSGPGLTLDESFNIDQGVYLTDAIGQHGPLIFTPAVARTVFAEPRYLPDHPPAGRLLLGMSHQMTAWLIPGSENCTYNVPAARLGSCFAFAVMVLLLVEFAKRRFDATTAVLTGAMLLCVPHLLGHSRLAALESSTNLAWTASMVCLLSWWTGSKPPTLMQSIVSGMFLGLLLLTKVQGIFFGPMAAIWALMKFRERAIVPLLFLGGVGVIVFFAGWPWLWLDPINHVMKYLGRTTERPTLYCWYLGERFSDKEVPRHFAIVMTLASLPAANVAGIICRAVMRRFDSAEGLAALSVAFPLIVFTAPGIPVYDGTRLFLIVMPFIVLLSARGLSLALQSVLSQRQKIVSPTKQFAVAAMISAAVIGTGFPKTSSPISINEYGLLCGFNRGAAALGLESSYWGESLNGDFWQQVPENSTVFVAPVSHQFQLSDLEQLVPIVQHRRIQLVPFEYDPEKQRGLLLLHHRLADLRRSMQANPPGSVELIRTDLHHTTCNRLIDTSAATWPSLEQ